MRHHAAASQAEQHVMAIEKWSDGVSIAHLAADPQLSDDLEALYEQIAQNPFDVVLDLSGVRYISSSHIARLLKLRKQMMAQGGRLMLCAIDPQVWGTFLVTGLDKVFEFSEAVPTALATLKLAQQPTSRPPV